MLLAPISRWRAAGPWIALTTFAVVWLSSMMGVFALPDAWAYRYFHWVNPHARPAPQVLLVEADFEHLPADSWLPLIAQLQRFGPRAIGVLRRPAQVTAEDLEIARSQGVVVGLRTASQDSVEDPVLTLPPAQWPEDMGRYQPHARLGNIDYTGTEAAVVSRATGAPAEKRAFLVDFRPGANYLPLIRAERVLRGDFTEDLVKGRVVLVGRGSDPTSPPLLTPLPGEVEVSRLDYAGYAVDTLLRGRPVRMAAWWQKFLLSLTLLATAAALYYRLGVRPALAIALSGTLLILVGGWLGLHFLGLVLPVAELIAFHLLLWYLLARREHRRASDTVGLLLRASSSRLYEHLLPQDFNRIEDPWGHIIQSATQMFSLERAILLERRGAKHLREIKSYRCSLDDIGERRRDFERTPYSTAIAEGGPILLEQTYLKNPTPGGRQFLAPLEFNGQVLGFFSGEVAEDAIKGNPLFLSLLRSFSTQIGELLYRRQVWQDRDRYDASRWVRLLRLNSRQAEHQSLSEVAVLLERRLVLLEDVINGLQTISILYDLFGQVIQINRRMEEFVERAGLPISTLSAAELLATLGAMPLATAREHLQHMVLTEETLEFSVQLPKVEGSFMLIARPLQAGAKDAAQQISKPFRLQGFLFELMDVSRLVRLERLKDELGSTTTAVVRDHLATAVLAAELARRDDVTDADRSDFQDMLERKLQQITRTLTRSQTMINAVQDISLLSDFPVSIRMVLDEFRERWRPRLVPLGLELVCEKLLFNSFVRVDVAQIGSVLDAVMTVLSDDSVAGAIRLGLYEQDEGAVRWTVISLENAGYGMSDERLQAILHGATDISTPAFYRIKRAADQVTLWGGRLSVLSAFGEGMHFEIRFPGFSLDDEFKDN